MDKLKSIIRNSLTEGGLANAILNRPWHLLQGVSDAEITRSLPGDDLVAEPKCGYTQSISINAPASMVWPWLVQIGYRRAGWYSHDFLHRLTGIAGSVDDKRASATRIIPELQNLKVGDIVEIAPGMGYTVVDIDPEKVLVLQCRIDAKHWQSVPVGDPLPEKYLLSSWVWLLEKIDEGSTRLIVRVRSDYDSGSLSKMSTGVANELGRLLMQPKTLRGIKQRAEKSAAEFRVPN